MKNPKEGFENLIYEINKSKGLDELTSKLISILFVEPREISLEELAERTGYSLSAVSMSMKMFTNSGLIKKLKKPKSRKVYFYMEKNIIPYVIENMKKTLKNIEISKKEMPEIIKNYKKTGMKEELEIAKDYYKRISVAEKIIRDVLNSLENLK
ncbi:MAG: winged helix-turn-helix transcriptional regulator [Candidatus Aenigmarchaeota archaeon]|nr:winged helix-turn-helix transcriptional regulator [Candidatus Aenigmarchaeota archaeon]